MNSFKRLVVRDADDNALTPSMAKLLIALLVLVLVGFGLAGILYLFRRKNKKRQTSLLPVHEANPNLKRISNHRRLTITATPFDAKKESIYVYNEKKNLVENSSSPPPSPVPEIRVTFPDEEDHNGRRKSGKVVVVRISECGSVGMEPCLEEKLPPYHSGDSESFQSLDLERMGGLKEKDIERRFG